LTLAFVTTFAHSDFWTSADYGNIKIRVKTGYKYEEIKKAFIIGQLAEKLSKELNYSDPIFLDFNHYYTGQCKPVYFVSYDKGNIEYNRESNSREKDYLNANSIILRQVSSQFDANSTLKLLEYSINNISSIKSTQKQIQYNQNYCEWRINSIDTGVIKKIIKESPTVLLTKILTTKIERPDQSEYPFRTTYYYQDGIYVIYNNNLDTSKTDFLRLQYVYQILETDFSGTLVFDTDSTFYNIKYNLSNKEFEISPKYIIDTKDNFYFYKPFTYDRLFSYFLEDKIKCTK
jgi:hypothetical protein